MVLRKLANPIFISAGDSFFFALFQGGKNFVPDLAGERVPTEMLDQGEKTRPPALTTKKKDADVNALV